MGLGLQSLGLQVNRQSSHSSKFFTHKQGILDSVWPLAGLGIAYLGEKAAGGLASVAARATLFLACFQITGTVWCPR